MSSTQGVHVMGNTHKVVRVEDGWVAANVNDPQGKLITYDEATAKKVANAINLCSHLVPGVTFYYAARKIG